MYTYVHNCMWAYAHHDTHVEGRRQPQGSLCLRKGLCAPQELAGKSTTTSNLTVLQVRILDPASGGSRDPNSGPHLSSMVNALTEQSPEPPLEGLRVTEGMPLKGLWDPSLSLALQPWGKHSNCEVCDFALSQAPATLLLPQRHKTQGANLMNKKLQNRVKVNSSFQVDYLRFSLQLHKANKIANRYTLFEKLLLGWIT